MLLVSLKCDACGARLPAEVECRDRAARGAIASGGFARGWKRHRAGMWDYQDLCPECAKKLPRLVKARKPRPRLATDYTEGLVIPLSKGGR